MKLKYWIGKDKFIEIETDSEEVIQIVNQMNNETDKERKKDRTYRKHVIPMRILCTKYDFEFIDEEALPSDLTGYKKTRIYDEIKKLPGRQRQVIIEFFYNGKSLRQIATENNLAITTIVESYHNALNKLKNNLSEFE